jgi:hypothetical protein
MRPEHGLFGQGAVSGKIVSIGAALPVTAINSSCSSSKRPCSALGNCGAGAAANPCRKRMVSGFRRNRRVGSKRQPVRSYSKMTGAIEATSNAAIVPLKGRVTRGSFSRRLSEAPKSSHTPLHGIAIKAQSPAMKNTLFV